MIENKCIKATGRRGASSPPFPYKVTRLISHEIWFNFTTQRYATIPNHPGDIPEGTRRAVLKQAGIKPDRR
jgi:HicA toxin of bacterial toxin-antitoxin,